VKARTKSAKLRAKRGRPPKPDALRTPGGQLSRSQEARQNEEKIVLEVATWKRRQINPRLTIEEARKMEHGSVIAQWLANHQGFVKQYPGKPHEHEFTQMHYDAALRYHKLHDAYLTAISAKRARSSSDFAGPGGFDGRDPFDKDAERRNRKTEEDYRDARRAILEAGPMCMMAMEAIVLENRPIENLRPDLRMALNRLAVLWKMQAEAA
jgi:hypothetical protein